VTSSTVSRLCPDRQWIISADALSRGIADAADRRIDPCLGQSVGVADGDVRHAAVAVMDQAIPAGRLSVDGGVVHQARLAIPCPSGQ
jgi:hypothetical protein